MARVLTRTARLRRCGGTRKADPTRQRPGACTQASATAGSTPARHDSGPRRSPTAPSRRQRHARRPDGRLERRAAAATVTYARVVPGAPLGGPARPHELSVDVCSHSTVGVLRALARFSPCRRPPPPSDRRRTPTLAGMTAVAHSAVRFPSALARPTFFLLCGLARARSSTRATSRRPCRSFCAGLELPSLMGARPARHSRTPWSAAPRALTPPTFAACAGWLCPGGSLIEHLTAARRPHHRDRCAIPHHASRPRPPAHTLSHSVMSSLQSTRSLGVVTSAPAPAQRTATLDSVRLQTSPSTAACASHYPITSGGSVARATA